MKHNSSARRTGTYLPASESHAHLTVHIYHLEVAVTVLQNLNLHFFAKYDTEGLRPFFSSDATVLNPREIPKE